MPHKLTWTDSEDIGIELYEAHTGRDPLTVRFTELRDLVKALPDFDPRDDQVVNEQILEAIQKFWFEEWQDNQ